MHVRMMRVRHVRTGVAGWAGWAMAVQMVVRPRWRDGVRVVVMPVELRMRMRVLHGHVPMRVAMFFGEMQAVADRLQ